MTVFRSVTDQMLRMHKPLIIEYNSQFGQLLIVGRCGAVEPEWKELWCICRGSRWLLFVTEIAGYPSTRPTITKIVSILFFNPRQERRKNWKRDFYVTEWLMMNFDFYTKKGKNIENPLFTFRCTKHIERKKERQTPLHLYFRNCN